MGKIACAIEKLVEIIDEDIDCFIKRISFIRKGELGKVRFIDEKILPNIRQKQVKQIKEVKKAFSHYLGEENVKKKGKN